MSTALSSFHIPNPPPGEDELPCDDGEPMETERHGRQMNVLTGSLELEWHDRDDFYVGGNMAIYFSELQAKKNDFRGPDVFVVLDTVRREHKSWVVWQEGGRRQPQSRRARRKHGRARRSHGRRRSHGCAATSSESSLKRWARSSG